MHKNIKATGMFTLLLVVVVIAFCLTDLQHKNEEVKKENAQLKLQILDTKNKLNQLDARFENFRDNTEYKLKDRKK